MSSPLNAECCDKVSALSYTLKVNYNKSNYMFKNIKNSGDISPSPSKSLLNPRLSLTPNLLKFPNLPNLPKFPNLPILPITNPSSQIPPYPSP